MHLQLFFEFLHLSFFTVGNKENSNSMGTEIIANTIVACMNVPKQWNTLQIN